MKGKKTSTRQYKGEQGIDAIWDGPLDMSGMPKGKGASNGANGIQLLAKNAPKFKAGPITEIAKGLYNEGMN
jgi:hypothetical protein